MTELSPDEIFAELDAEIALVAKNTSIKSNAEINRRKSLDIRRPKADRDVSKALYLEAVAIQEANAWLVEASCAMFTHQYCDGCGSSHWVFLQFMEKLSLIRLPTTVRWQRVPALRDGFPRETIIQNHKTHICSHCASDHGFTLEGTFGTLDLSSAEPFGISPTYYQEDANATNEEN